MTGTIERINDDLVIVLDRSPQAILAARLWGDGWTVGQTVAYERIGEGDTIRVDGTTNAPVEIYAAGGTLTEIAANLNMDEDQVRPV